MRVSVNELTDVRTVTRETNEEGTFNRLMGELTMMAK
jgi:hypothetical protein